MVANQKVEALRAADEAARRAFHEALCDGADYAGAMRKGSAVYREAFAAVVAS